MSRKNPLKQKWPNQPRVKNPIKPLVPYDPNPPPAWLIKEFAEFPTNPTSPGLGNLITVDDVDHVLDRQRIDELAASDLFSWRANDVILAAVINAYPSSDSVEKRMAMARKALFGEVQRGPSSHDDDAILWAMACAIMREKLVEHREPRPLAEIIASLFEASDWGRLNPSEQKTTLTRLRRKFNRHREQLLAEATANFHPAQQARWHKVQDILRLLRELRILPDEGSLRPGTQF